MLTSHIHVPHCCYGWLYSFFSFGKDEKEIVLEKFFHNDTHLLNKLENNKVYDYMYIEVYDYMYI